MTTTTLHHPLAPTQSGAPSRAAMRIAKRIVRPHRTIALNGQRLSAHGLARLIDLEFAKPDAHLPWDEHAAALD